MNIFNAFLKDFSQEVIKPLIFITYIVAEGVIFLCVSLLIILLLYSTLAAITNGISISSELTRIYNLMDFPLEEKSLLFFLIPLFIEFIYKSASIFNFKIYDFEEAIKKTYYCRLVRIAMLSFSFLFALYSFISVMIPHWF